MKKALPADLLYLNVMIAGTDSVHGSGNMQHFGY